MDVSRVTQLHFDSKDPEVDNFEYFETTDIVLFILFENRIYLFLRNRG